MTIGERRSPNPVQMRVDDIPQEIFPVGCPVALQKSSSGDTVALQGVCGAYTLRSPPRFPIYNTLHTHTWDFPSTGT